MGVASGIPWMLRFYGIMTAVFAVFYALMYWGARRNVRVLRAMGRGEVEYYDRFIELVDGVRPVVLPVAVIAFVGGVGLSLLVDGTVARAGGLAGFAGYMGILIVVLGWVAKRGVEAGERLGAEGVEPFRGPFGLPTWLEALAVNYAILGVVFVLFWQAGMFTGWTFAPLLWVIAAMAVFVNPVIVYRRYRSLESDAPTGDTTQ